MDRLTEPSANRVAHRYAALSDAARCAPGGMCFRYAANWDMRGPGSSPDDLVVHGYVEGLRGPHAWVERKDGRVFDWQTAEGVWEHTPRSRRDLSSRQPDPSYSKKGWPKREFYAEFKPHRMKKYRADDATINAVRSRKYGPWTEAEEYFKPISKRAAGRLRIYGKHRPAMTALWRAFVPFVLGNTGLKVTLHPKKSMGRQRGYVDLRDLSRGQAKVYFLAGDIGGVRYSLTSLGHELVHVLQHERGDLQVRGNDIWWKGKPIISAAAYSELSYAEHAALPWEKEAITKGAALARAFLSDRDSLWGLDPVLDYLMNDDPDFPHH